MKNAKNYISVVICGTGGQGIFTLTKIIHALSESKGLKCLSSSFKGGAQKHGSVHSEIKIFTENTTTYKNFSVQLLPGELDVILAAEPHECLRFQHLFHENTKMIVNTHEDKLFVTRFKPEESIHPVPLIKQLKQKVVLEDFNLLAQQKHQSQKMANYEIMHAALENKFLPFTKKEFEQIFMNTLISKI